MMGLSGGRVAEQAACKCSRRAARAQGRESYDDHMKLNISPGRLQQSEQLEGGKHRPNP